MRASAVYGLLALLIASCDSGGSAPAGSEDAVPVRADYAPLPDACDMLQEIDLADYLDGTIDYVSHTPALTPDSTLSACDATPESAYLGISLVVRQQAAPAYRNVSTEQATDVARSLAASGVETESVDIGDAAFWAGTIHQLHIFYRRGSAYLIVTTRGADAQVKATAIGRALLETFP